MNKPFLLFALKCSVILYFTACTGIDNLASDKSATPIITKGAWKIEYYTGEKAGKINDLSAYHFFFGREGELKAVKNEITVMGNWSEDNITKCIRINLGDEDPDLAKLNDYWNINDVANLHVDLKNAHQEELNGLKITAL